MLFRQYVKQTAAYVSQTLPLLLRNLVRTLCALDFAYAERIDELFTSTISKVSPVSVSC